MKKDNTNEEYADINSHEHHHELELNHDHPHDHSHSHPHGHQHSHQHTKAVVNRLSRAIGHLESVRRMVEENRDCSDVLVQLSAVIAALNSTGKVIIKDHMEHCIVEAVELGDMDSIKHLSEAIDRFIK